MTFSPFFPTRISASLTFRLFLLRSSPGIIMPASVNPQPSIALPPCKIGLFASDIAFQKYKVSMLAYLCSQNFGRQTCHCIVACLNHKKDLSSPERWADSKEYADSPSQRSFSCPVT